MSQFVRLDPSFLERICTRDFFVRKKLEKKILLFFFFKNLQNNFVDIGCRRLALNASHNCCRCGSYNTTHTLSPMTFGQVSDRHGSWTFQVYNLSLLHHGFLTLPRMVSQFWARGYVCYRLQRVIKLRRESARERDENKNKKVQYRKHHKRFICSRITHTAGLLCLTTEQPTICLSDRSLELKAWRISQYHVQAASVCMLTEGIFASALQYNYNPNSYRMRSTLWLYIFQRSDLFIENRT